MKRRQLHVGAHSCLRRTVLCGMKVALLLLPCGAGATGIVEWKTETVAQQAKKIKITGTVVDDTGSPLPGVTLLIKGTTTGCATDIDGKFMLEVPENTVLVASFVGMKPTEVKAAAGKPMKIVLAAEAKMIDEVVVTGYQKIDRKLFTGAASRVEMGDMKLGGETDVAKKLEGQVAGVSVQNVSSTFGTAPKIRVRGASSIYGTQKPLWVVDGIVLEDGVNVSVDELNSGDISTLVSSGVAGLNTDDIESMQILKDVSATALYGARAMNGVIVITTKKGRTGHIDVNYSTNISIKPVPTYDDYNILDSKEQMSIDRELYEKGWITVAQTQGDIVHGPYGKMFEMIKEGKLNWASDHREVNAFLRKYETANTDWFDVLFKPGVQQQHTLSFSGGGESASLYASIGYLHDGGWTLADEVDRYTALVKGTFKITKNFTLTAQANLSYRDQKLSGVSDSQGRDKDGVNRYSGRVERNFDNNPFMYALQTSRSMRAYDENGDLEYFRRNFTDFNIIEELTRNQTLVNVRDMSFMTDLNYQVLPKLSVTARLSARYFTSERSRIIHENSNEANAYRAGLRHGDSELVRNNNTLLFQRPDETTGVKYSILPEGGIYENYMDLMNNYYMNANVNWNPSISDQHLFTFMFGTELRFVDRENKGYKDFGHFFDGGNISKPSKYLGEYMAMQGASNIDGPHYDYDRFVAFFLNYGYSFRGKYTFNGTVRYDGSNRLGHSRSARWLPTWNLSGKWAVKEESFLEDAEWLSTLNLRLTYGLTASMGIASNSSMVANAATLARPFHPAAAEMYISVSSLANDDLTWEKQYEMNAGLDIGFFDNRLNLEFNYYNRRGFDLIGYYKSNSVGGQLNKMGNIADMDSHGVEFAVNATPVQLWDFRWNININYAYHKAVVKNLLSTSWAGKAVSVYGVPVEDGPVRGIYSTRFAGLDHQGIPTFYDRNNEKQYYLNMQTTDFADFEYSGNLEPTGTAGMQHTFSYKGVTLSVLFSGQFGHKKRVMQNFLYFYNDCDALSSQLKNRWRVAGDEYKTNIPAILDYAFFDKNENNAYYDQAYNHYGMSDLWLADASFVRLKNVSLNYNFPSHWLSRYKIRQLSLGVQGTNLALVWLADRKKLAGEDPEFVWSGGTSMPISKQYTVTLSIGF